MEKNKLLSDAFLWLFIGLLVAFLVSYASTLSLEIATNIYLGMHGLGYIIFIVAEIIIAIVLSARIHKLSETTAKILYLVYAALTGLSLTGIFIIYTPISLGYIFLATSLIFGIFALIGKLTKIDLSKIGIYLFIALISIIVLEIINIFLMNNTLDIALSALTIIIFSGYVAYDINHIMKNDALAEMPNAGIFLAFQLFLDFINIFIELLRLFGKSRD